MRMLVRLVWLACLTLSLPIAAAVTEVIATVDKNPAMVDESITLQIEAKGDVLSNAFDSSALLKDFVVGRTSVSTQTKVVNSSISKSTIWNTVLIPRQPGQYTIPAISIGAKSSLPIKLMILPASASQNAKGRDVFVTTDIDVNKAYLQQQVRYTARLHLATDLQRGSLSNPTLTDAEIRQVGKDKEYSQVTGGKRYRIIERVFAIIPNKSGKFTIEGPLFEGEVIDQGRQSFGFFNRTKTINRIGPSQELTVLPVPPQYKDHWLPSEMVELHQEWQPASGEYKVGEPITRTLTLTAMGLVEEQLPDIDSQYPDNVKVYPDQANSATVEKEGNLIAQRIETEAIIPSKAGQLILPAVEVPWFNVVTGRKEVARLPGKTIEISANSPSGAPSLSNSPALPQESEGEENLGPATSVVAPSTTNSAYWSISSWVFLGLWLITLFAWFKKRPGEKATSPSSVHEQSGEEAALWSVLQQGLKKQDPQQVHQSLSQWLACYCQNPGQSLASSQLQLNHPELNHQVTLLLQSLFGKTKGPWQANQLMEILKSLRKHSEKGKSRGTFGLKKLYPTH